MQPLKHYIDSRLKEKVQANHLINSVLRNLLPTPLNQHVWVIGVEKTRLELLVDSALWATRLRYQQRELLKQINSDPAFQLTEITISVSGRPARTSKQQKIQRNRLSLSAKKAIRNAALTVTDEEIRAILERMASR